jgi:hypothetical protein
MKITKKLISYILTIAVGATLLTLAIAGVLDSFWGGMGASLLVMSILRLSQLYLYKTDKAYHEKMDTEVSDERNRFLRNKAWAWAGYLFVLIAAVCTIVFKVMEQELLWQATGLSMCLIVTLYWISFLILRKKY